MIPVSSISSLAAISSSLLAIYTSLAYATVLPAKRQLLDDSPGFTLHSFGTGVRASNIGPGTANASAASVTVANLQDAIVS